MIHILEENLTNDKYKNHFVELIKCHHNDVANYFKDNYVKIQENKLHDIFIKGLTYFNFAFISNDFNQQIIIFRFMQV